MDRGTEEKEVGTAPSIIQKIVVLSGLDAEAVTHGATLRQDLSLDSLDAIELAMDLEATFRIAIDDTEIESAETVQDVITLVERKLQ